MISSLFSIGLLSLCLPLHGPSSESIASTPVESVTLPSSETVSAGGPEEPIRIILFIGDSIMSGVDSANPPEACPGECGLPLEADRPDLAGAKVWHRWRLDERAPFDCQSPPIVQPQPSWLDLKYAGGTPIGPGQGAPRNASPVYSATKAYMELTGTAEVRVIYLAKRNSDVPEHIWNFQCTTCKDSACPPSISLGGNTWSAKRTSLLCMPLSTTSSACPGSGTKPGPAGTVIGGPRHIGMYPLLTQSYLRPAIESLLNEKGNPPIEFAGVIFSLGNNMAASCPELIAGYVAELDLLLQSIKEEVLGFSPPMASHLLPMPAVGVRLHSQSGSDFVSMAQEQQDKWFASTMPPNEIAGGLVDLNFLDNTIPCCCPSATNLHSSNIAIHPFWEGHELIGDLMGQELALLTRLYGAIPLN